MYAGTGIYSLPEAPRLIGVHAWDIRRWLYGYPYTKTVKGVRVQKFSKPLWSPQTVGYDLHEQAIGYQAKKWYPSGNATHIVLDPARQFGSPIVEDTGTPTDVLYASFLAEGQDERAVIGTASSCRVPIRFNGKISKQYIRYRMVIGVWAGENLGNYFWLLIPCTPQGQPRMNGSNHLNQWYSND